MWLRYSGLSESPFEIVLAEEAEQATPVARVSVFPAGPAADTPCQCDRIAPDARYAEFYDAADRVNDGNVQDWRDMAAKIEKLSPADLKMLRRLAAYQLHPDRMSDRAAGSGCELAILNARIDARLRTFGICRG